MRGLLSRWAPVLAWCAVIFWFSSMPDLSSGLSFDYPLRKCAHMTEYWVLFVLTKRALGSEQGWEAFLFCAVYAATDEYHQSFVPGRHASVMDVGVDSAGALLAWARSRG